MKILKLILLLLAFMGVFGAVTAFLAGSYGPALGVLVLAYAAWPTIKKWWEELTA